MARREVAFLVPGALDVERTGGYEYDRRMVHGLRARGWRVDVHELDPSFPNPTEPARQRAGDVLRSLPDNSLVIIDGLALGAMPSAARREAGRLRLIGLVHHPLARERGLDPAVVEAFEQSEREALSSVRLVVVTSTPTGEGLAEYGIVPPRVVVVEPGTDRAGLARGSGGPGVHLICVATITPRKGHATLIAALAQLRRESWTLTCAGSQSRDPETMEEVDALVRTSGLGDRIQFVGELGADALDRQYDRADVFVLPTWHEGYGMAVAEALARGLPVVSTPTGAIPSLVRAGQAEAAGLLVSAGDVEGLATALGAVMRDAGLRGRLSAGARAARERLRSWADMAARMDEALSAIQR